MRTLKFKVAGQTLTTDPNCDFSGLAPGAKGCIRAEFSFSDEWNSTNKVVGFYSRMGREYAPQVLTSGRACIIPFEALQKRTFKIQVFGQNGLITNRLEINQGGGSK